VPIGIVLDQNRPDDRYRVLVGCVGEAGGNVGNDRNPSEILSGIDLIFFRVIAFVHPLEVSPVRGD
jgi:hypothetical protein